MTMCATRISGCRNRCRLSLGGAIAAIAIAAALTGCSQPASDGSHELRFAIIPKALHIPVFDYARTGAEREAGRLGGIEVIWRGPESTDEIRQKEILESFIAQRVDGIAISCLNGDLLTDAIDRAVAAGIPVVTWDSDAPRSKRLAFYGVNDVEGGRALGDGLATLLSGKGKVAIITSLGADNLQKRLEGARAALQAHRLLAPAEVLLPDQQLHLPRAQQIGRRRDGVEGHDLGPGGVHRIEGIADEHRPAAYGEPAVQIGVALGRGGDDLGDAHRVVLDVELLDDADLRVSLQRRARPLQALL